MNSPEFDADGYPSVKTLLTIETWPICSKQNCLDLLNFCIATWYYKEGAFKEKDWYVFNTGGWSGNESVINAMECNRMFWITCWYSSQRGGHYKFKIELT